jgi:hypothetical protein
MIVNRSFTPLMAPSLKRQVHFTDPYQYFQYILNDYIEISILCQFNSHRDSIEFFSTGFIFALLNE